MKVSIIDKYGDPEKVFKQIEVVKPEVFPGQVLIKVKASSINPIDYKIREGGIVDLVTEFPLVLQGDISGVIEQVGEDVKSFKVGDKVFGYIGGFLQYSGALAQYVVVNPLILTKMPDNIDFIQASAIPLVGLTAYQMVFEKVKIKPNQKVLVYGATGGMGHVVLQLAKICGAEVHAMVSSEDKAKLASKLGADYTIDYKKESIDQIIDKYTNGQGYDVVFDNVGGENLPNSFALARVNGSVVSTLARDKSIDISILHQRALSLHFVYMITPLIHNDQDGIDKLQEIMNQLAFWIRQSKLKPLINKIFDFDHVAQAHLYAQSGQGSGKTIVRISE
jgi:NADPH2:quinone reductase